MYSKVSCVFTKFLVVDSYPKPFVIIVITHEYYKKLSG
jgi:hypothetical protein